MSPVRVTIIPDGARYYVMLGTRIYCQVPHWLTARGIMARLIREGKGRP